MKHNATMAYLLLATLLLFAIGVAAQHSQHHPPPSTPKSESPAKPMTAEEMMAHHQEVERLVNQLVDSAVALEADNDPEALRKGLADHRALLAQLQSKLGQRSEMMQRMSEHMKNCPMMGSEHKHNQE